MRVLVDMSATLVHHGHVRLLKKAKEYGDVIVALSTDEAIKSKKKYEPELTFLERKEIIEAIKYVSEVIPSPWLISNKFLMEHNIDLLIHGNDNENPIHPDKLLIFKRTAGISSSLLRARILSNFNMAKNEKAQY